MVKTGSRVKYDSDEEWDAAEENWYLGKSNKLMEPDEELSSDDIIDISEMKVNSGSKISESFPEIDLVLEQKRLVTLNSIKDNFSDNKRQTRKKKKPRTNPNNLNCESINQLQSMPIEESDVAGDNDRKCSVGSPDDSVTSFQTVYYDSADYKDVPVIERKLPLDPDNEKYPFHEDYSTLLQRMPRSETENLYSIDNREHNEPPSNAIENEYIYELNDEHDINAGEYVEYTYDADNWFYAATNPDGSIQPILMQQMYYNMDLLPMDPQQIDPQNDMTQSVPQQIYPANQPYLPNYIYMNQPFIYMNPIVNPQPQPAPFITYPLATGAYYHNPQLSNTYTSPYNYIPQSAVPHYRI